MCFLFNIYGRCTVFGVQFKVEVLLHTLEYVLKLVQPEPIFVHYLLFQRELKCIDNSTHCLLVSGSGASGTFVTKNMSRSQACSFHFNIV